MSAPGWTRSVARWRSRSRSHYVLTGARGFERGHPLRRRVRRRRRYDARMAVATDRVTVIVYSNQPRVRAQVRTAVGRRPAPDIPRIDWIECDTSAAVVEQIDLGEIDLVILDA